MTDPLQSSADQEVVDPEAAVREVLSAYERITSEVHKVIVGQDEVIDIGLSAKYSSARFIPGLTRQ